MDDEKSWAKQLPSLSHLTVSDIGLLRQLATAQLPQLSSFTVHTELGVDLSHISVRTLHLTSYQHTKWNRSRLNYSLVCVSRPLQQLAINDPAYYFRGGDGSFASGAPGAAAISGIVYFEWVEGFTRAGLTELLTPSTPPVFAAQLTHLALRVHLYNRAAAAALLSPLPSMYPSLTHVHIGVEGKIRGGQSDQCVEWDAAVQSLRAALGSAWCVSTAEVIACREDVAWRRSMGLPLQM